MYHVAIVLQVILWDIATQSLTTNRKKDKGTKFFILKIT